MRRLAASMRDSSAREEQIPGAAVDSDEGIAGWIRTNAWGHHASCTAAIGDPAAGGVVSKDFRVHGVRSLRIVDASVFPRIPGFLSPARSIRSVRRRPTLFYAIEAEDRIDERRTIQADIRDAFPRNGKQKTAATER